MEQTGELVMNRNEAPGTIPGIGPKVDIGELELRLDVRLAEEIERYGEEWLIEMMHAQRERYEWFAGQVDPNISIEAHARTLMRGAQAPGAVEYALASLSRLDDSMARVSLNAWQPPEHDLELSLFHQICLAEAFGSRG